MTPEQTLAPGDPSQVKLLVVDDQPEHASAVQEALQRVGYNCEKAAGGKEALCRLDRQDYDIVITDLVMADLDGMELLRRARERLPDVEVILVTGFGSVESAVEAMRQGAFYFMPKPLNIQALRELVARAAQKQALSRDNLRLRQELDEKYGFHGIVGNSPQMEHVFKVLRQIAPTTATVLITGESGTGKELVARSIHNNSPRKNKPFVALNCAALSEGILESELFGHTKGAFTGALADRLGRFEYAHGGTLFLDEVGDLPISTQIKLLRVIEQREIMRVGSNEPVAVDVRLLAATNVDLDQAVAAKTFREDLLFRLKVVSLALPRLRERQGDIPLLTDAFVAEFRKEHRKEVKSVSPAVRRVLATYHWPGNVRELRNCVENMVVITTDAVLDEDDVPAYILERVGEGRPKSQGLDQLVGLSVDQVEKILIEQTLSHVDGNRDVAAKMLGIGTRTLYRKLAEYGLK